MFCPLVKVIIHYLRIKGNNIPIIEEVNSLEVLDVKTALRTTLTQKQELVRDYQSFASTINDTDVAKMYRHFAEAEALHATQIKEKLDKLQ